MRQIICDNCYSEIDLSEPTCDLITFSDLKFKEELNDLKEGVLLDFCNIKCAHKFLEKSHKKYYEMLGVKQ